jgi:oxygen-independent coproporphyrinogen-3 oxidase
MRSRDDRERALVIEDILCGRSADLSMVLDTAGAAEGLMPFIDRGLVRLDGTLLIPLEATRPYARTIAALFDPYRIDAARRFSSAV